MKKFRKMIAIFFSLSMIVLCFSACSTKTDVTAETSGIESGSISSDELKIGVIQYMSHPSLDNCYSGIKQALDESGLNITVDYQVGSSNSADSDCTSFASNMVSQGYDMIIAIATPAAQAAFAETADTDIPVVFSAVSDPEGAELVDTNENPGSNCTGTSDVLDLSAQVDMIQTMQPDVDTIGILYTSSEANSISNLARFQEICDERNITVDAVAVQTATDIPSAAEDLASRVDCINNFTDNNVVNNLDVVLSAAANHNIPVYGSEEEQVKNGCLASVSIDYVSLGKTTGEMAVEILNGADASTMAVQTITDASPVINTDVLTSLGLELPESYKDASTVTTEEN